MTVIYMYIYMWYMCLHKTLKSKINIMIFFFCYTPNVSIRIFSHTLSAVEERWKRRLENKRSKSTKGYPKFRFVFDFHSSILVSSAVREICWRGEGVRVRMCEIGTGIKTGIITTTTDWLTMK